jgi:hypothetical protein
VWSGADGWHARVVGPDAIEHEFTSPFELARYVARPFPEAPTQADPGLR